MNQMWGSEDLKHICTVFIHDHTCVVHSAASRRFPDSATSRILRVTAVVAHHKAVTRPQVVFEREHVSHKLHIQAKLVFYHNYSTADNYSTNDYVWFGVLKERDESNEFVGRIVCGCRWSQHTGDKNGGIIP